MSIEQLLELLSPYRTFDAADEWELRDSIAAAARTTAQPAFVMPYGS
ncbi:MAG TPA: hypothetical protein VLI04_10640 [Nocardioidaceae bacterium]|nr:hypothetical protein [Nocardioidaceae bacterium]